MNSIGTGWEDRTRQLVTANNGSWKPCVCIQGGGAKGAWEAGVLSRLLENGPTAAPVATWGTSAGALNSLWASTLLPSTPPRRLFDHWLYIGTLITFIVLLVPAALFGLLVGTLVYFESGSWLSFAGAFCLAFLLWVVTASVSLEFDPVCHLFWYLSGAWATSWLVACGVLSMWGYSTAALILGLLAIGTVGGLALVALFLLVYSWLRPRYRLPGLLPIPLLARFLPAPEGPARWHVYMCTADVTQDQLPTSWDFNTLGIFCVKPAESQAMLVSPVSRGPFGLRTAAMCSAGLPIACQPYPVERHRFLDGGMEANLPGGFIRTQGPLAGYCIICIIPHPESELDPGKHISHRTLQFLYELKGQQAYHRGMLLRGASTAAPHAMCPVLIVSPPTPLSSRTVHGFLRTDLMTREFEEGRMAGEELVQALARFVAGDNAALNGHLLDYRQLSDPFLATAIPRPGRWALWTNPRWM